MLRYILFKMMGLVHGAIQTPRYAKGFRYNDPFFPIYWLKNLLRKYLRFLFPSDNRNISGRIYVKWKRKKKRKKEEDKQTNKRWQTCRKKITNLPKAKHGALM